MSKVSVFFLSFLFLIFLIACGDEAASDNDSGFNDNETVNDDETSDDKSDETVDEVTDESPDETADETVDETIDETVDNELNDDLSDEDLTDSDETADETIDEVQPDDDSVTGPSEDAILCCEEIIKEWFRCEGTYDSTKIKGCTDCLDALNTCSEFNPSLDTFACTAECNAICEGTGTADNTGKDRRKVADGYCRFVVDQNCGISPEDVSSFGAVEGLDACYDL